MRCGAKEVPLSTTMPPKTQPLAQMRWVQEYNLNVEKYLELHEQCEEV